MKTWIRAATVAAFCSVAALAQAETVAEAKALLDAAHAELKTKGVEGAVKEFNAGGKWKGVKAYVVVADFKGNMLAHAANEKIVGKNMYEAKDATGKPFVQEVISGVQAKGETNIEFRWANPTTKKIDDGKMVAKRVPGQDAYVGVTFFE
jgi:sensor histidine kinase regulating citrate/malate metabolism